MLRTVPHQANLSALGIDVFESRHAREFAMQMGEWDFDKLCMVRQGRGKVVSEDGSRPLQADDILYITAGTPHQFVDEHSDPLTLVLVCFYGDTEEVRSPHGDARNLFKSRFVEGQPFSLKLTHRRSEILSILQGMVLERLSDRLGSEISISGQFSQLLVLLARSVEEVKIRLLTTSRATAFAKTLDYIEDRFTDPIQIKDLAIMAGLSYRRYTDKFKTEKGLTVNDYLTKMRLGLAKKRLKETDNIMLVAMDSGFGDLSHFYRVFKKHVGMTPRQFVHLPQNHEASSPNKTQTENQY